MSDYNWSVQARFEKRNDEFHRTKTYLQWGSSNQSLGCCLLLNPGSSLPDNTDCAELTKNNVFEGTANRDDTMKQLAAFVERITNGAPDGTFHIYNLFTLRNPESENAIDYFKRQVEQKIIDVEESLVSVQELQEHPWMLLGWGCKQLPHLHPLQEAKKKWMHRVRKSSIKYFGVQNSNGDYYHPLPRGDKKAIIEKYVAAYNAI